MQSPGLVVKTHVNHKQISPAPEMSETVRCRSSILWTVRFIGQLNIVVGDHPSDMFPAWAICRNGCIYQG